MPQVLEAVPEMAWAVVQDHARGHQTARETAAELQQVILNLPTLDLDRHASGRPDQRLGGARRAFPWPGVGAVKVV